MSLSNYKLTDDAVARSGVVAAPDKLTGTASQNKAVFDRLVRETVRELFNGLIDALAGEDGAAEIGTSAIGGVAGGDVQTVLGSLKTILDTKLSTADANAALALKSDKSVTDLHFKAVTLNAQTGVFTFTREDGSFVTVDTVLEKVATNWRYDAPTQSLVLTLADGTAQSVPLSAFITETEFEDSAQLAFSVSGHKVTATVRAGSITDAMLSSALLAQLQSCVAAASDSATDAAQSAAAAEGYKNTASQKASEAAQSEQNAAASALSAAGSETAAQTKAGEAANSAGEAAADKAGADASAVLAESYARGGTGTRAGEDTDNARYYKEQAAQIAGGDYATNTDLANAVSTHNASASAHGDIRTALGAHAESADVHVTAAQKAAWSAKQNALTFDTAPAANSANPVTSGGIKAALDGKADLADGKVPAAQLPQKSTRVTFSAADWVAGTNESTITVAAATHGITGASLLSQFRHLVSGAYVCGTWACEESWAEIDASTHAITLHGPAAGYDGAVTLFG